MKKILEQILASLAKRIIVKYKPKVIGITGSIGKTSTKEAIFAVLQKHFRARQTDKNYNNEIGLPLTIIGVETGGRSLFKWLGIVLKAMRLLIVKDYSYPEVLILEMGADKPGDIDYLVNIAPCDIGVVTKVAPVHIEFFGTIEKIANEKRQIVAHIGKDGFAILNGDDELVRGMEKNLKAQVLTFGYNENLSVRAIDLEYQSEAGDLTGAKFKVLAGGSAVPVFLPRVIGQHQTYSALAATAVGVALGLNLVEISEGLRNYMAPKGRMNLIEGIHNALIIDDTYNSSPDAAMAAVKSVANLKIGQVNRRLAVLGDMLELGEISESAHEELGATVAENGYNILIAVGQFRASLAKGAKQKGMENVFEFENSVQAGEVLKTMVEENDIILVKGSQGARMEKVVKNIMAKPGEATDLLVRQSGKWLKQ